MSENDRYRIESRLRQQGRGLAPSPEDIEALKERQRQAEKLLAQTPERAFDNYLGDKEEGGESGEAQTDDDEQAPDADTAGGGAPDAQPTKKANESAQERSPAASPTATPGAAQRAHQADAMQALLNQRLAQKLRKPAAEPKRASFFAHNSPTHRPTKK